jgi:hypothetical protein
VTMRARVGCRVAVTPVSNSTPVRATAAELRRMCERKHGEGVDSPSAATSPGRACTPLSSVSPPHGVRAAGGSRTAAVADPYAALVEPPNPATAVIVCEDLAGAVVGRAAVPRREKSLGALCQKFVSFFLLGRTVLCLDEAAKVLMGPKETALGKVRTKIRRLYDIANVLCTLRLLEKVHVTTSRKPGFVWRGPIAVMRSVVSHSAYVRHRRCVTRMLSLVCCRALGCTGGGGAAVAVGGGGAASEFESPSRKRSRAERSGGCG